MPSLEAFCRLHNAARLRLVTRFLPVTWLPYNRQAVSRLLIELGHQSGLLGDDDDQVDRLYPHRLRHTFVTMLLDRDVPLPAVQDAARHASADTTRLYDRSRVAFREHPTHKLVFD